MNNFDLKNSLEKTVQKDVFKAQSKFRNVTKRNEYLESLGYEIERKPMGSGGVGQIKEMTNLKEFRVQTSYGIGTYNYAYCIIIKLRP